MLLKDSTGTHHFILVKARVSGLLLEECIFEKARVSGLLLEALGCLACFGLRWAAWAALGCFGLLWAALGCSCAFTVYFKALYSSPVNKHAVLHCIGFVN